MPARATLLLAFARPGFVFASRSISLSAAERFSSAPISRAFSIEGFRLLFIVSFYILRSRHHLASSEHVRVRMNWLATIQLNYSIGYLHLIGANPSHQSSYEISGIPFPSGPRFFPSSNVWKKSIFTPRTS